MLHDYVFLEQTAQSDGLDGHVTHLWLFIGHARKDLWGNDNSLDDEQNQLDTDDDMLHLIVMMIISYIVEKNVSNEASK